MPKYNYTVMVEGQKQLETTSLDEAEKFKLAKEQEGGYNVTIKRHWYMDELITRVTTREGIRRLTMSKVSKALENLEELTDSEVLDLIYDWSEELTEYEIMTNPILNGLINILEESKT